MRGPYSSAVDQRIRIPNRARMDGHTALSVWVLVWIEAGFAGGRLWTMGPSAAGGGHQLILKATDFEGFASGGGWRASTAVIVPDALHFLAWSKAAGNTSPDVYCGVAPEPPVLVNGTELGTGATTARSGEDVEVSNYPGFSIGPTGVVPLASGAYARALSQADWTRVWKGALRDRSVIYATLHDRLGPTPDRSGFGCHASAPTMPKLRSVEGSVPLVRSLRARPLEDDVVWLRRAAGGAQSVSPPVASAVMAALDAGVTPGVAALSPGVAAELLAALDASVAPGTASMTGAAALALMQALGPAAVPGSAQVSPAVASAVLAALDAGVSSVTTVAPQVAAAVMAALDGTVQPGVATVSPDAAAALLRAADPTVVPGLVVRTPGAALTLLSALDGSAAPGVATTQAGAAVAVLTGIDPAASPGVVVLSAAAATAILTALDPAVSVPGAFVVVLPPYVQPAPVRAWSLEAPLRLWSLEAPLRAWSLTPRIDMSDDAVYPWPRRVKTRFAMELGKNIPAGVTVQSFEVFLEQGSDAAGWADRTAEITISDKAVGPDGTTVQWQAVPKTVAEPEPAKDYQWAVEATLSDGSVEPGERPVWIS